MADTASEPPTPELAEDESIINLSTLFLALVTLAIYLLFLKPTGNSEDENNNTANANANANANNTNTGARGRQRQRGGGRRMPPQAPTQPTRRRQQMSDHAIEVLGECHSLPPHVLRSAASRSHRTIGGFDMLSENGLVAFSHTRASVTDESSATASKPTPKIEAQTQTEPLQSDAPATVTMDRASSSDEASSDNSTNSKATSASLLQRKERAKILSRLFAATNTDASSKGLPAPPSKGSTFVIGVSRDTHLSDSDQRASLLRVLKGLATHYTVLLVVFVARDPGASGRYESTQELHSEALRLLRGSGNDDEEDELPESVLPSHRVLLSESHKGRVALVRQLSTNIGLTVDFDGVVREELERFGYEVSIVDDWNAILPAGESAKP